MKSYSIFLISPQAWSGFKVSKHHYAEELGKRGHRVYFLEPALTSSLWGRVTTSSSDCENVSVVHYAGWLFRFVRFHSQWLYRVLCRFKIKQILRHTQDHPDVVWDMDNLHQFPDLSHFLATLAIYHPVDAGPVFEAAHKHADLIFSLSEELIPPLMKATLPWHLFPHGLNAQYGEYARRIVDANWLPTASNDESRRRVVGYVGNLDAHGIDWKTFDVMVRAYPNVDFQLIGPYADPHNDDPARGAPAASLAALPNVHFRGYMSNSEILEQADEIDIWLLMYDPVSRPDAMINSHKVLEYLATGKPVLSHHMQVHRDERLVFMPTEPCNVSMPEILGRMLACLGDLTSPGAIRYRAEYAMQFRYDALMDRMLATALPALEARRYEAAGNGPAGHCCKPQD